MAQQLGNNYYNSPFKFNGKELDEETGFYYYGARYYDPKISIWLSVDPLAEKFPNFNPYNYVMQNPLNLIDPTGMSPEGGGEGGGEPKKNVMLVIHNPSENEKHEANYEKEKKNGWDIIFAPNIQEGLIKINKKYNNKEIDNFVLSTHSANGSSLEIGSYKENELKVKERTMIDNENLSTYNGVSRSDFINAFLDKEYGELLYNDISAFKKLADKVKDNGNFIISACSVGNHNSFPLHIMNTLGKNNFTYYFNQSLGGFHFGNQPESIKSQNIPNNNFKVFRYSNGQRSTLNDLIINNDANNPLIFK